MVSTTSKTNVVQESWLNSLWFSSVPHLKDACTNSLFGIFNRVFTLPSRFCYCVNPLADVAAKGESFNEFTRNNIEASPAYFRLFFFNDADETHDIPREKVHYIIDRVTELATKMGIHKKIRIFPSRESPAALGSLFSKEIVVYITKEMASLTNDEIDFIVSHELTHAHHNHFLKETVIKTSILVLEILGAIFLSPLTIPLFEIFASPLENFGHRVRETDADQTALKTLNTNAGAVSYFSNKISRFKSMRAAASSRSPEEQYISPSGDNRLDIIHPPYSARLANAQSFHSRL